ncbi:MAG: DHH family phosphoesterase [Spirochaetota bacterium]|nr:DHH family phosphoesterase [Spirochaetota bacterium]
MIKHKIKTIHEKNKIINNIINAMADRKSFLILGHINPDEDCVSSMIAFAILLTKFDKIAQIYINSHIPGNIVYLLDICKFNSIDIINNTDRINSKIDTIVICDTPKRKMVDMNKKIAKLVDRKDILKIEIDHHIASDGEYIGDEGYSLVTDASSTCELIGIIALKLRNKRRILRRFLISDPFSRNLVLSILTGIVGDTNMGQYLKSRREKIYYDIFANMYNDILMKVTIKETNFTKIDEIFQELQKLSVQEEECYDYIIEKQNYIDSVGYIILNQRDMDYLCKEFDEDIIVSVSKHIANELAERSGKVSLLVYYDNSRKSDMIQFRMRRCHDYKKFDLRRVLDIFTIHDGGGHEGAIGFRFPRKDIKNLEEYTNEIIDGVVNTIAKL